MFLIVSIQIIKGINIIGVPWGTKWLNIWLVFFSHPNIKSLVHKGRAKVKLRIRCLVPVKIYGNKPMKLLSMININIEIKINVILLLLLIVLNSLLSNFINFE